MYLEGLLQYLKEKGLRHHAKNSLRGVLARFQTLAESEEDIPPKKVTGANKIEIKKALIRISHLPVTEVHRVSYSGNNIPDMFEVFYTYHLAVYMGDPLCQFLKDHLRFEVEPKIQATLRKPCLNNFNEELPDFLEKPLKDILTRSVGRKTTLWDAKVTEKIIDDLYASLMLLMNLFILSLLAEDKDMKMRVQPMIRLFARRIFPFCEGRNEPRTWLVLVP